MTPAAERASYPVIYDPDAVRELRTHARSKDAHRSILNAVLKLQALGERLEPPNVKMLKGQGVGGLRELRPKQGRSDWRVIYRRAGSAYVILAVDRHANFAAMIERAQKRAQLYRGDA